MSGLEVFIGSDPLLLAFLRSGGHGFVSGPAVAALELYRALFDAHNAGNLERADAIYRVAVAFSEAMASGGVPQMKLAAEWRGLRAGRACPHRRALSADERATLTTRFDALAVQAETLGVRLEPI